MNHTLAIALAGLFLCLFLSGCEKEKDQERPVVEILHPASHQSYSIPDTIHIEALVSDNKSIEYIQINIVNELQQPVSHTAIIENINKKEYHLKIDYIVDNPKTESGTYYLQVTASDGITRKNAQQKITLNEADKMLQKYLVITKSNPNQISTYELDTNGQLQFVMSEPTDYLDSQFMSYHQQLIISGSSVYDVKSFEAQQYKQIWHVPVLANPPEPYFTALNTSEKEILLGFYNGDIARINASGKRIQTTHAEPSLFPYQLIKTSDFIVSAQRNIPNNQRYINSYFLNGGGLHEKLFINYNVHSFYNLTNNQMLILGNDGNTGSIWTYNLVTKNVWNAKTINQTRVISSCQISENDYLISGESNLYWYRKATNSLTTWKTGYSSDFLLYEPLSQTILSAQNSQIHQFRFPSPAVESQTAISEKIHKIHAVYNR
ncbi:MAG: hypothetical protein ACQESZ_04010 [Bacteroidota bacterium]